MTATNRPASKMVELGQVIQHHRLQRGHTARAVADFVGASLKLYNEWEEGKLCPDNQRWSRMCRMIHQLSAYRPLWNEALAEQALRDANKPLTSKLGEKFAAISLVPDPPPEPEKQPQPEPAVEPEPAPAEERGAFGHFDVSQLPPGWRLPEQVEAREAFAREYIRQHPEANNDEIREAQKAKFGLATAAKRMTEVREDELAKMEKEAKAEATKAKRQLAREERAADPYAHERGARKRVVAPQPAPPQTADEQLQAALELIREAVPNLATLTFTVDAQGEASVAYTVREVKVVETSGNFKLGAKK